MKKCYYAGMGINPECYYCHGFKNKCPGDVTVEEFCENMDTNHVQSGRPDTDIPSNTDQETS